MEHVLGVIGGSGLYQLPGVKTRARRVKTPFGAPSDAIREANLDGTRVLFLPRHGENHQHCPSNVPYRANVWALKHAGVRAVLAPCSAVSLQADIPLRGHALQCRVTTEDPEQNFIPDYGRITAYRGATGFGIRLDGGTAYSGAVVTRFYDPMLEKITAWAATPQEAIAKAGYRISVSGTAADEIFSGYYDHHLAYLQEVSVDPAQHAAASTPSAMAPAVRPYTA